MLRRGIRQVGIWRRAVYFNSGEQKLVEKREKELRLAQKIKEQLRPTFLKVDDISIGSNSCGQMYNITVESQLFVGKSKVQQHKMVTSCIGEQLKTIHGYNLKTKAPQQVQQAAQTKQETKQPQAGDKPSA